MHKLFLSTEIVQEKTEVELRERIGSFSMDSLKHTEMVEKLILPNKEGSWNFLFCLFDSLPQTLLTLQKSASPTSNSHGVLTLIALHISMYKDNGS